MSGVIIQGSPNIKSGNSPQGRIIDFTIGECGHTGIIITGSPNSKGNSRGKARIGDQVTGCNIGIIITGNPTHLINTGSSGCTSEKPITRSIIFQNEVITYTEVDVGNIDDEPDIDDGLNIYPPVVGPPTPEQITRSETLDVSPTELVFEDTTADLIIDTPPVDCVGVPDPVPTTFPLTEYFTVGQLSTQTAISNYVVKVQHGLTISDIVCNLQAWAENIGGFLSDKYGRTNFIVTSGFRHGSSTSQHERGQAADIQFPKYSIEQIFEVAQYIRDNIPFDQLILEYGGNRPWIHISFNRAGNRLDTAPNKFGTRVSPGNYVWKKLLLMQ
jgi:hypothetical protein